MKTILLFSILALPLTALADDMKKIPLLTLACGHTYKSVTITKVEPDGICITHETGLSRIPFEQLPVELQKELGHDPQKAKSAEPIEENKPASKDVPQKNEAPPVQSPPLPTEPDKQEKIDGAFGMKLGDVLQPANVIGKSETTDGTPMYEFSPSKPFRSFTNYYVLITPTTHKIYEVWGIGSVANTETGKNEQALIMELLQKKYGAGEKPGIMDTIGDAKRISQGTRHVVTKINGLFDVKLEIRYIDTELEDVAEKERIASEKQKVDPSGL